MARPIQVEGIDEEAISGAAVAAGSEVVAHPGAVVVVHGAAVRLAAVLVAAASMVVEQVAVGKLILVLKMFYNI